MGEPSGERGWCEICSGGRRFVSRGLMEIPEIPEISVGT